jgi:diguanylate cyclase (GGDEF)-like protein
VLREGRIFLGSETCGSCRCATLPPITSPEAMCVPLTVAGETLGVLHFHLPITAPVGAEDAIQRQLAVAFGEQAALGLANVRLRTVLHEQSIRDPLTGLFNRRYLEETLQRELHRATRDHYPVGVIMLDVDHFKRINDTYGHEAGDAVLRALGTLLLSIVRAGDMACRYGGEEFVLILPSAPLPVLADRAEVIRQAISRLVIPYHAGDLPPITASLGVSVVADATISVMVALAQADAALYAAKHAGRNQVIVHA